MAQTIQLQSLEGKVDKGFDRLNYIIVGIVGTSLFGVYFLASYSGFALLTYLLVILEKFPIRRCQAS